MARKRWPKGTYMQIVSPDRLRAFVGPEPDKRMSGRRLARAIGKHPSFIDHLLAGRSKSCLPVTAERIAEALGVPLDVIFVPETPSATQSATKREDIPA